VRIAILTNEGQLRLYRNPESLWETWEDGRCSIGAKMKADDTGIVLDAYDAPSHRQLASYFRIPLFHDLKLTRSEMEEAIDNLCAHHPASYEDHFRAGVEAVGGAIVDDPKPTNAEKLAKEILTSFNKCEFDFESSFEQLAKALDARGIKAPGGDDE
jgi:hypothetical protein